MVRYLSRPFVLVVLASVSASLMCTRTPSLGASNVNQGCLSQWLFNGVWRVEVTGFEPYMNGAQQTGWQVTEVWRNGTSQGLAPSESQLQDQQLELSNGTTVAARGSTSGTLSLGSVANNSFAPAGQYTYKQIFLVDNLDPSNKPKAADILFNGSLLSQMKDKPQFTSSKYDFRFKLDCTATGAAAQAQGGSTQIAAIAGCMNQWVSNGVWKMRVTAVNPNQPTGQFGWFVVQEWQNVSNRRLYPGGLPDMAHVGGPVYQSNVTDEYLVTQSGNNASSANSVGDLGALWNHVFDQGATWSFQQGFYWSPFDPSDKPVRFLATFDTKAQNALPNAPHYKRLPANFRIDLTCTK
ncbi:MAG TPA: hypothetical protein VKT51_05385 [Candidatus Eremiobacteraceae bacterium]|nr:hypothetical protein [Candidatus Eremiobacteraceae bacterium]